MCWTVYCLPSSEARDFGVFLDFITPHICSFTKSSRKKLFQVFLFYWCSLVWILPITSSVVSKFQSSFILEFHQKMVNPVEVWHKVMASKALSRWMKVWKRWQLLHMEQGTWESRQSIALTQTGRFEPGSYWLLGWANCLFISLNLRFLNLKMGISNHLAVFRIRKRYTVLNTMLGTWCVLTKCCSLWTVYPCR